MGRKKKVPTEKDNCGCEHDGHQWVKFCTPHETELAEHHKQAQLDHIRIEDERMNDRNAREEKKK